MDFTIPQELELLKRTAKDFRINEIEPISQQIEDEDHIPDEVVEKLKKYGYFGIPFPRQYLGAGAGELGYCLVMEEFGKTNSAFGNLIGAHTGIGAMACYLDGTKEQKEKYLTKMCTGEMIAAFALTEPNAGSDAAAIQTTAERQGDKWILNGNKCWITNGPDAHLFTVMAVNDKALGARGGVSAFLVEKDFPGFSTGTVDVKMGLKGSHTCELFFDNCEVPAENILGKMGLGFITAMKTLDMGRIGLAAGCIGGAERVLDMSIDFAKQRVQFGKPIAKLQAVQWMLADIATELYMTRWAVYHAAWKVDQGKKASDEAAMVKLFASEMLGRAVDNAVQVHGGMGYMADYPMERAYRDARIMRIYEGTSEIQKLVIANSLLRK